MPCGQGGGLQGSGCFWFWFWGWALGARPFPLAAYGLAGCGVLKDLGSNKYYEPRAHCYTATHTTHCTSAFCTHITDQLKKLHGLDV